MKLNLNDQIKEMLIQAAEQDKATTGEMKALSHYANVAIAEYFKQGNRSKGNNDQDSRST